MRILINDFAGHPFQVQLSRELAKRGHHVLHTYLSGLQGPKGELNRLPNDPPSLAIRPLCLNRKVRKYSLLSRYLCHRRYGAALSEAVYDWRPDAVLSANMPIDIEYCLQQLCSRQNVRFVHWMQDLYGPAMEMLLRRKLGPLGRVAARHYHDRERRVCQDADAVVMVTMAFSRYLRDRAVSCRRSSIVENWAPLNELQPLLRNNPWREEHSFGDDFLFLYSGTLGLKHRPELLWRLAETLGVNSGSKVVVTSEGPGREYLDKRLRISPSCHLSTMNFQPYRRLPEALSASDVLVAIIDSESSRFAVPSKVLSYLCVGRPVLLASPADNLAAEIVNQAGAGIVVDPGDTKGFVEAGRLLRQEESLRRRFGANARRYALEKFDIAQIADRFINILHPEPTSREICHSQSTFM